MEFPGALVLVTHDRYMIDRVSTNILALDGEGGAEYFADYAQWESSERKPPGRRKDDKAAASRAPRKSRLSYLEQREFAGLEEALMAAEARLRSAQSAAEDPKLAADASALQERFEEIAAAQDEVERLYHRWAELEGKS
jgi:ATP-binding cassette subfamily F protein uup